MVNASEVERSLVALDEPQDLLVEIETGVPDQGAIPEDPQHHLAASLAFFFLEEHRRECRGCGLAGRGRRRRSKDWS